MHRHSSASVKGGGEEGVSLGRGLFRRRRFLKMQVRHGPVRDFIRFRVRADPFVHVLFPQHQRHPVVDEGDLLAGRPGEHDEVRETVFKTVQSAEPGDMVSLRLDQVFVSGFLPAVRPEEVLPFIVPGSGNHTAMRFPCSLKERLVGRGLQAGVRKHRAFGYVETPLHRKAGFVAPLAGGDHRSDVSRADFSTDHERLRDGPQELFLDFCPGCHVAVLLQCFVLRLNIISAADGNHLLSVMFCSGGYGGIKPD